MKIMTLEKGVRKKKRLKFNAIPIFAENCSATIWRTAKAILRLRIMPYFGNFKLEEDG